MAPVSVRSISPPNSLSAKARLLLSPGLLVLLVYAHLFSYISATYGRDDLTDDITALPSNGDRSITASDRHSLPWRRRSSSSFSSTARPGALLLSLGDIERRLGTKMLPEGIEVATHVVVGNTTRLYFIVKKDNSPLNVVIMPCLSSVSWSLYYDPINAIIRHRHFADQSVAANYSFDGQQPLSNQTGYDVMNHDQSTARHGVYRLEIQASDSPGQVRLFVSTSLSTLPESHYPLLPVDKRVKLATVGQHEFVASWRRSRQRLYEDDATLNKEPEKLSYCVVVNRKRNLRSLCAVELAFLGGIGQSPTLNKQVLWQPIRNNAWNSRSWISSSSSSNLRGRFRSGSFENSTEWKLDDFKCSMNQTHYRYRSAVSSTQYYVDVLVIDSTTGAASVYQPGSVLTRPETKTYRLRDSMIQTFSVSRTSPIRTIEYRAPPQWQQQINGSLTVAVQLCDGTSAVRLDVQSLESESSNSTPATPMTSLSVLPGNVPSFLTIEKPPGTSGKFTIVLTLLNNRRHTRSLRRSSATNQHVPIDDDYPTTVRIYASGLQGLEAPGFPFPIFPADRTVQVFETLVSCRSATVAWILAPSKQRQLYCVRVTPAVDTEQTKPPSSVRPTASSRCAAVGSDLRRRRHINGGGGGGGHIEGWTVSGSQTSVRRVSCRLLRIEDPRRTAVTETLTGLEPNETYSVDVFVVKTGRKGQAIAYDRTVFRTKPHC